MQPAVLLAVLLLALFVLFALVGSMLPVLPVLPVRRLLLACPVPVSRVDWDRCRTPAALQQPHLRAVAPGASSTLSSSSWSLMQHNPLPCLAPCASLAAGAESTNRRRRSLCDSTVLAVLAVLAELRQRVLGVWTLW